MGKFYEYPMCLLSEPKTVQVIADWECEVDLNAEDSFLWALNLNPQLAMEIHLDLKYRQKFKKLKKKTLQLEAKLEERNVS